MSFLDKVKKDMEEKQYGQKKSKHHAVKNPYKNDDGSLNKTSVTLSAVAIVLVLLLGGYSIISFQTKGSLMDDVIYGLSTEDAEKAVQEAFYSSLQQFINGDITEDELKQAIAKLINDYLSSTNGFTDQQLEALNVIIGDYLDTTTIYSDIDKNKDSIEALTKLINEKYENNYKYISEVESQLSKLIESNTMNDDLRYEELVAADKQLKAWLDDAQSGLHSEINETKISLTQTLTDLTELFMNTVGGSKWEEGIAYAYGSYVFDDKYMYVSKIDGNTAALTDETAWEKTDIKTLLENLDQKFMDAIGAVEYDASTSYNKSEYVFDKDGNFYISIIDNNLGNDLSDTSAWKKTDLETIIKDLNQTLQDVINSVIGAKTYTDGTSYKEGDYIIYEGNLYVSNVNNNTYPITDETGWTKSDLNTIINELTKSTDEATKELYDQLKEIIIKQGSDYKEVTDALKAEIDSNKLLSVEQKEALKEMIDTNQDKTETGMENLSNNLNYAIDEAVKEQNSAREELAGKVSDLKNKTAEDAEALKSEINANKALSDKEKEEMNALIDKNEKKNETDMGNLSDSLTEIINKNAEGAEAAQKTLTGQIDALKDSTVADLEALEAKINSRLDEIELKQSSDLAEVKDNLTGIIDANEKLSEEERGKLKTLIDDYAEDSAVHLSDLQTSLTDTINANKTESDSERDKLSESISSLKDSTTADKDALKAEIDSNKALSDSEKEQMKALIDANKDESEQGLSDLSDALTQIIEKNKADSDAATEELLKTVDALEDATATDIDNLRKELTGDIDALRVQQSSDLNEVQKSLITAIDNEKKFTEEERSKMKDAITKCADDSQASLDQLNTDLSAIISENKTLDETERTKIQGSVDALKDATASDIAALNTALEAKISALDSKVEQYNTTINNKIDESVTNINAALKELEEASTWSKTVTYDEKAYVTYYNGSVQRFYHSLQANNVGHEPGTTDGTSWWEEVDTVTLINGLQSQVTDNKNHLLDINGSGSEFQYGVSNGKAGYYVNGTFNPF